MGDPPARLSRREWLRRTGLTGGSLLASAACAGPARLTGSQPAPRAAVDGDPSGVQTRQSPGDPLIPVRVRVGRLLAEAGLYVALERGYFDEQGLTLDLVPSGSVLEAIQQLATGRLHASVGSLNAALFNALARGVPLKMVVAGDVYLPWTSTAFLIVRQELVDRGAVRDYRDLAGLRLAVPARGAFLHYLGAMALRQGGLEPGDVELVELSPPDINAALAAGVVDVGTQLDPLATLAAERGIAAKWRSAGEIQPGLQGGGFFFSADLLEARREIGQRWMVAYLQGVRHYLTTLQQPGGRQELAAILTRYTSVTDAALYERMAFPYLDPNGHIDEIGFSEQVRWHVEQGNAPGSVEFGHAIDRSFAEVAVRRLGRYP
jgi:NitT/TauT family transport system substrate-binding protein